MLFKCVLNTIEHKDLLTPANYDPLTTYDLVKSFVTEKVSFSWCLHSGGFILRAQKWKWQWSGRRHLIYGLRRKVRKWLILHSTWMPSGWNRLQYRIKSLSLKSYFRLYMRSIRDLYTQRDLLSKFNSNSKIHQSFWTNFLVSCTFA